MGREIRRVPANYVHPKNEYGNYKGLFDGFNQALKDWDEEKAQWDKGFVKNYHGYPEFSWKARDMEDKETTFEDWSGERPVAEDYMPDFPEHERTHIMMFETCSEGSPLSPAFKTPEELARWLADNDASSFGSMTASYEHWLAVCEEGFAPSAVMEGGVMKSGVEFMATSKRKGN